MVYVKQHKQQYTLWLLILFIKQSSQSKELKAQPRVILP